MFDALFFLSWGYLILSAQMVSGFPPFYVHFGTEHQRPGYKEDTIKLMIPRGFLLFISMGLFVLSSIKQMPGLSLLASVIPFYLGLTHREFLKQERDLPYPLIDFIRFRYPFLGNMFNKWPMLVFDAWTLGLSGLLVASLFL